MIYVEYDFVLTFNLLWCNINIWTGIHINKNIWWKDNINYLKLALLHDCGKENLSLFIRVKKVLIGDKKVENHPKLSYKKLKNINNAVGELALSHHLTPISNEMKIFQELDDK